jgi:hypothetical protein
MNRLVLGIGMVVGLVASSGGCLPLHFAKDEPIVPTVGARQVRPRIPMDREFRLAAFDFGARVDETGDLVNVIPAMLLTELRNGKRFAVYEGGNIRLVERNASLEEGNAKDHVDGILSGTISTVTATQICFDLRLSNAVSYEVLYSRSVCVPAVDRRPVDRAALRRVAEEVERSIKRIDYGKVTSADGEMVICDKGSDAGVMRGMVAYVVASGDTVQDLAIHKRVHEYTGPHEGTQPATAPVVVGELYVVSVEKDYSVGLLRRGSYMLPGDTVFFK